MRPPGWDARDVERFVRQLRMPRDELLKLDDQLRLAGWEDYERENLKLGIAELGQAQALLLRVARRLRERGS